MLRHTIAALLILTGTFVLAECKEVGYLATFDVKAGSEAAFEEAIMNLSEKVMEVEQGVLLYAPYKGSEPGRYYMLERYASEAARAAHGRDPQVQVLFGPLGGVLAGAAEVEPISAVCRSPG